MNCGRRLEETKGCFPPPSCWTRGVQEEKRAWVLLSFVLSMLEKWEKSNGGVGLRWPATKGGYFEWISDVLMHGKVDLGWRQVANSHWTPNLCVQWPLCPYVYYQLHSLRFIYNKTIGIYDIILTLILFYYY